ncbi:MAG: (Fe-S)-binding protein [Desulfatibacillaceae bacterium]|nr:(Fe-S)-binding protein [Desulfatibacillaceae bacterium]
MHASCQHCGLCLSRCQYMDLTQEQASMEIFALEKGQKSIVLEKCISCFACNAFCPNGADPYGLILEAWNRRYQKEGLPARARYLMPTKSPNFRENAHYTPVERQLHAQWAQVPTGARRVLYAGCNLLALPLLAMGSLFENLPVFGRFDLCCGEMYFRMGLLEPARQRARYLTDFFKGTKIQEMVFACPACYNMFKSVLPERFGAEFDFECLFLEDILLEDIKAGRLAVSNKLSGTAVMHDSCHGRILGREFLLRRRQFLHLLGLKTVETQEDILEGLCCGMAAGCNSFGGLQIAAASLRQLKALGKSSADMAAVYCTGCLLTLTMLAFLQPFFATPIVHHIELMRRALGEGCKTGIERRSAAVMAGVLKKAVPGYLNPARFFI